MFVWIHVYVSSTADCFVTQTACFRGENCSENLVFGVDDNTTDSTLGHHQVQVVVSAWGLVPHKNAVGLEVGHNLTDFRFQRSEKLVQIIHGKAG